MSFSTAKASISGNSVVPGLPNTMPTPSCLSRSRNARFPDITGTGDSVGLKGGVRSRLRGALAVGGIWRAGRHRQVRMGADPRRADRAAHEGAGRASVADEFRAVGMDAGGAEQHRAHRHQAVRRGDDFEGRKVVTVVLDRRPDMAPLLALELLLRGHNLGL